MWRMLLILMVLAGAMITGASLGQSDDESEISLLADFGFAGKMPTGKNTPVRVWVQAGSEHLSGVLELEYESGQGLSGRVVSPVEAAAGASVSVPMVVPMPEWCERITVTLRAKGGLSAKTVYESLRGPTSIQLKPGLDADEELLLSLTDRFSARQTAERFVSQSLQMTFTPAGEDARKAASGRLQQNGASGRPKGVMSRVVGVNTINPELPVAAAAYEGVLAVIADDTALNEMDPRAITAIQQWVLGGGRLVVLADRPGSGWQKFLPPGVPTDQITMSAVEEIATPSSLQKIVGTGLLSHVSGRVMRLGLLGEDIGWRERWAWDDGAFIVEGPAGLGWVTIVSVHPGDVGAVDEVWRLWADVLGPALETVDSPESEARTLHNSAGGGYVRTLGRSLPGMVFDRIGRATSIGPAAVALVAVVTISLAVALGPVDFFLLKALRLRQFAWLSALFWIAVASGFALVAPSRLRAGPSTASRLVVVDALVLNEALDDEQTGQKMVAALPAELRAVGLGMTHFFAGSSDKFEVDAGGVWFEYSSSLHETVLSRPTTMRQQPAPGGIESVRTSTPVRIDPGVWSVKTYIDQGAMPSGLTVRLERGERGYDLRVTGLGAGARIEAGQLRVGEQLWELGRRYRMSAIGDPAVMTFDHDFERDGPSEEWSDPYAVDSERQYLLAWISKMRGDELMPSAMQALPGIFEHDHTIETYLASGRFAVVYLYVVDQPIDIGVLPESVETDRKSVYRLVVPIETSGGVKEAGRD